MGLCILSDALVPAGSMSPRPCSRSFWRHANNAVTPCLCLCLQVVGWVLSSVKTDWESSEWQQRWVSPAAFASTFLDLTQDAQGQAEVGTYCSMLTKVPAAVPCKSIAFRYHHLRPTEYCRHLSAAHPS